MTYAFLRIFHLTVNRTCELAQWLFSQWPTSSSLATLQLQIKIMILK